MVTHDVLVVLYIYTYRYTNTSTHKLEHAQTHPREYGTWKEDMNSAAALTVMPQRHSHSLRYSASVSSSLCSLTGVSPPRPCSLGLTTEIQANACHDGHLPTRLIEKKWI